MNPAVHALAASARPGGASLEDQVHDAIREAIVEHRMPPGTKLRELALGALFGVNRSVVRRVLARLAHARLVELRPNRGAIVASPSASESRELFAARRAIEGAILDRLAATITREQLRRLRALTRREHEAYLTGELRTGLKASLDFHRELAAMAGNSVLAGFLDELLARTPLVVQAWRGPAHGGACALDEHAGIVAALAAGDADAAVARMRAHLEALERLLGLREDEPPADLAAMLGLTPA